MIGRQPRRRRESHWREPEQRRYGWPPPIWWHWLSDDNSLTHRLRRQCRRRFEVAVHTQAWERPLHGESRFLGMAERAAAFIREVTLLGDGVPWVFARTIVPWTTLQRGNRHLLQLGNRPLGEVLFRDPATVRGAWQFAELRRRDSLYEAVAAQHAVVDARVLWGRRRLFYLNGRPLLVNEIFLPALQDYGLTRVC